MIRSRNNSLCAKIDSSMSCNESFNNHDMTITSADSAIKSNPKNGFCSKRKTLNNSFFLK